ncbi:MAG: 4-hydroxy-tetrahydrodipicolinate synthase [Clostridiales bacterium]|nr:4-hydroxy-tetrahydrodipicolinate synthase [Clostridiales bacterium]
MAIFTGVGAAMVTPFGFDGVDYAVLEHYIEHLISGGVSALIPFGTTGEPSAVTHDEYVEATRFIIDRVKSRVPVIVGAGSNSTAVALQKAAECKALGADGVLVVTPYYNKCTQNGLVEHYHAVAEAAQLPVIAYNVPSRTGVNIEPNTIARLAKHGVVGIKEASGDIDRIQNVAQVCHDVGLDLYCGNDNLTTVFYAMGGKGVISVAANPAPKHFCELTDFCEKGDYASARQLQFKLNDYIAALNIEVNPIPVKKALQLLGIDVGRPRLPLTELEPQHTETLKHTMQQVGLAV